MTVLLGSPPLPSRVTEPSPGDSRRIHLDQEERDAMAVLADAGMVPRLRLVPAGVPARESNLDRDRPSCEPRRTG